MRRILAGAFVALMLVLPVFRAQAQEVTLVNPTGNEALLQGLVQQVIALLTQQVAYWQEQLDRAVSARLAAEARQADRDKAQDERTAVIEGRTGGNEPGPKPTYTEVRCELAKLRCYGYCPDGDGGWTRRSTTWQDGEVRSNDKYSEVRECRRMTFYQDGSGLVVDEPAD